MLFISDYFAFRNYCDCWLSGSRLYFSMGTWFACVQNFHRNDTFLWNLQNPAVLLLLFFSFLFCSPLSGSYAFFLQIFSYLRSNSSIIRSKVRGWSVLAKCFSRDSTLLSYSIGKLFKIGIMMSSSEIECPISSNSSSVIQSSGSCFQSVKLEFVNYLFSFNLLADGCGLNFFLSISMLNWHHH